MIFPAWHQAGKLNSCSVVRYTYLYVPSRSAWSVSLPARQATPRPANCGVMPSFQPCVHRLPGVQCWDAEIDSAHTAHMYVCKCVNTLLLMTQLTSKVGIYFVTMTNALGMASHMIRRDGIKDRKSTRLNSSHLDLSRMPSSA